MAISVTSRIVNVIRAGRLGYGIGLRLQKKLSAQSGDKMEMFKNYLILLEHTPVYTIGIRTKDYNEEIERKLRGLGAEFFRTNRGGLITFHGPGQLVAYPVIHLKQFKLSMRLYINSLEATVIETCKEMGLNNARTTKDTGIWVGDNKICAIGVHGSRYVTTHGIGLNCNTDLSWFDYIVPCGIPDKGVTSLSKELHRNVTVDEAINPFLQSFSRVFDCELKEDTCISDMKIKEDVF